MKLDIKSLLPGAVRFTITTTLVFALVFGLIWALTQWAKYEAPIEPDPEGTVSLTATAAQLHGSPNKQSPSKPSPHPLKESSTSCT